jgi:6-pyruvoyltetrahydropterin/6-carboxytetrahydropterin synthase
MHLTRELRIWLSDIPEDYQQPSTNSWSGWPVGTTSAPFVMIRTTLAGQPHAESGYICDVKQIDALVRNCIATLAPTTDSPARLLVELWQALQGKSLPAELIALETVASPYLCFQITKQTSPMVTVTQQFEFSASHRLHNTALSAEENLAMFGKCNNPNGHGHNYVLDVSVSGEPDPRTGNVMPVAELDQLVRKCVIDRFDHRHLNEDTAEFKELNPTVENIATVIWNLLAGKLSVGALERIRVYETPKTWAELTADQRDAA